MVTDSVSLWNLHDDVQYGTHRGDFALCSCEERLRIEIEPEDVKSCIALMAERLLQFDDLNILAQHFLGGVYEDLRA